MNRISSETLASSTFRYMRALFRSTSTVVWFCVVCNGCGSPQPCGDSDYPDAIIGVMAGEHQVSIEYDAGYGRYKATEGGCHYEVSCPQYRCSYSVTVGPSRVTLYAIVDSVEQAPFEMKLRSSGCGEDMDYVEFDATKTPPQWSDPIEMTSCR